MAIVVPTAEGGASLVRLTPLPAGAKSMLSVKGDFRPLTGSERCAALTAANGPIARVTRTPVGSREFCFDRSPGDGRGWEAAVVFALLAERLGVLPIERVEDADVVVIAYGSVDVDLHVGPEGGDIGISRSLVRSTPITEGPVRKIVRVGDLPRSDEATSGSGGDEIIHALGETIVAKALGLAPRQRDRPLGMWNRRQIVATTVAGLLASGLVFGAASHFSNPGARQAATSPPTVPTQTRGSGEPLEAPSTPAEPGPNTIMASPPEPSGPVLVRLLQAPPNRRCEEVVFETVEPIRISFVATSGEVDLVGRSDVCGLELAPSRPDLSVVVRSPRDVRIGTIEQHDENESGTTRRWTRVVLGTGARRINAFDAVLVDARGGAAATLAIRLTKR